MGDETKLKSEKKLNDHINRLLMLGVSPSTVNLLRRYLLLANKQEIGDDQIEMIGSVNEDKRFSQQSKEILFWANKKKFDKIKEAKMIHELDFIFLTII